MRLDNYLQLAVRRLTDARADAPRLAAQVLVGRALGLTRAALLTHDRQELSPAETTRADALLARYAHGEPLAYITGCKEFFSRDFVVTSATLIPRPETEELCEAVLATLPASALRFADLGCGSGCIGATLLAERPAWRGALLDISTDALAVTRVNCERLGLTERAQLVRGDMQALPFATGLLTCIVSNPPYVSGAEYDALEATVREYEPKLALTPDPSGLARIQDLTREAARVLTPGGHIYVEHGCAQGDAVKKIFSDTYLWKKITIQKDLSGHDRWCHARRK